MIRHRTIARCHRARFTLTALLLAAGLLACGDSSPTPTDLGPRFAPGGGGPPVKVTATDPSEGEQGDTLTVRVLGSNFEPGAVAEFKLDGVPPGKVRTNSTSFISETELQANITIEADAELGLYDVEVTTPGGKKGVGTELFTVKEKGGSGPPGTPMAPLEMSFRSSASDGLKNDLPMSYVDDVDDVRVAVVINETQYGDVQWNTDRDPDVPGFRMVDLTVWTEEGGSAVYSGLTVARGSNGQDSASHRAFINAELNDPQPTRFIVYWNADPYRYELRFGTECGAAAERPAEKATVTLIAENPRTWTIESSGPALLCRRELERRRGKPGPGIPPVSVFAPFQVIIVEK